VEALPLSEWAAPEKYRADDHVPASAWRWVAEVFRFLSSSQIAILVEPFHDYALGGGGAKYFFIVQAEHAGDGHEVAEHLDSACVREGRK